MGKNFWIPGEKKLKHTNKQKLQSIQSQINEIRNSINDRQSWLAWEREQMKLAVDWAKLKAASQVEKLQQGKEYFKPLLGNYAEITEKEIYDQNKFMIN